MFMDIHETHRIVSRIGRGHFEPSGEKVQTSITSLSIALSNASRSPDELLNLFETL